MFPDSTSGGAPVLPGSTSGRSCSQGCGPWRMDCIVPTNAVDLQAVTELVHSRVKGALADTGRLLEHVQR